MQTTRRDVLAHGAKVIATAAVLPFIPAITPAQAHEDAELFALYEEYHRLRKSAIELRDRRSEAWFAVLRDRPEGKRRPYPEFLEQLNSTDSPYPPLKKKHREAVKTTHAVLTRFLNIRANTAPGLFLKLTIGWFGGDHRAWEERGFASDDLGNRHKIVKSVLLDLQHLSGRRL